MQSGISDYCYELLHEFRRYDYEVVVYSAPECDPAVFAHLEIPVYPYRDYLQHRRDVNLSVDLHVYHMGNNHHFHKEIYDQLLMEPGIVVLHDLSFVSFYWGYLWNHGLKDVMLEEATYSDGYTQGRRLENYFANRGQDENVYEVRIYRRIVEASYGVLVHSQSGFHEVRNHVPSVNIKHVWMGVPVISDQQVAEARERFGWTPDQLVVGLFGIVGRHKRIHVALAAFKDVLDQLPNARMVIIGRPAEPNYQADLNTMVAELGIAHAVEFTDSVPMDDFNTYLKAVDVVINLRWPTTGETSATMMRAFGAGKVVIATDLPQFREFPESFCWRVPVDGEEQAMITRLLLEGSADLNHLRYVSGQAARQFVEENATWKHAAAHYDAFIKHIITKKRSGELTKITMRQAEEGTSTPATQTQAAMENLARLFNEWEKLRRQPDNFVANRKYLRRIPLLGFIVKTLLRLRNLGRMNSAQHYFYRALSGELQRVSMSLAQAEQFHSHEINRLRQQMRSDLNVLMDSNNHNTRQLQTFGEQIQLVNKDVRVINEDMSKLAANTERLGQDITHTFTDLTHHVDKLSHGIQDIHVGMTTNAQQLRDEMYRVTGEADKRREKHVAQLREEVLGQISNFRLEHEQIGYRINQVAEDLKYMRQHTLSNGQFAERAGQLREELLNLQQQSLQIYNKRLDQFREDMTSVYEGGLRSSQEHYMNQITHLLEQLSQANHQRMVITTRTQSDVLPGLDGQETNLGLSQTDTYSVPELREAHLPGYLVDGVFDASRFAASAYHFLQSPPTEAEANSLASLYLPYLAIPIAYQEREIVQLGHNHGLAQVLQAAHVQTHEVASLNELNGIAPESVMGVVALDTLNRFDQSTMAQFLDAVREKLVPGGFILTQLTNPLYARHAEKTAITNTTGNGAIPPSLMVLMLHQREFDHCRIFYANPDPTIEGEDSDWVTQYQEFSILAYRT
jgi:glycosyltransferase involved in cell wall biosynthesis/uncharacterized protein YoxC